VQAAIAAY